MDLHLFIPLTKVDAEKRLVYGCIAAEVPDKSNEIMDYATARPQFEAWSADIAKASDGRSVGNLRAMHGSVAAGKLETIAFDDENRRIEACGKIVDDAEWAKVLEGVYTGFSMGGKYLERWKDADNPLLTRYTPRPDEVSLVDNPCIPAATFEVVKHDGTTELRKFKPAEEIAKAGARHSADDLERVQAIHDAALEMHNTAADLGAECDCEPVDGNDSIKMSDAEEWIKSAFANSAAIKRHHEMQALLFAKLDEHLTRIEKLESQPAGGGPVLRGTTVLKGRDASGASAGDPVTAFKAHLDTLSPDERAHALMKFSLATPLARAP